MKRLLAICLLISSASLAQAGSWGFNNFSWSPNMSWGNSPSWGTGPQGFSWDHRGELVHKILAGVINLIGAQCHQWQCHQWAGMVITLLPRFGTLIQAPI